LPKKKSPPPAGERAFVAVTTYPYSAVLSERESKTETSRPSTKLVDILSESGIRIVACKLGTPIETLGQDLIVSSTNSGSVGGSILGNPGLGVGNIINIEVDVQVVAGDFQVVFHIKVGPGGKRKTAKAGAVFGVNINIVQGEALSQRLPAAPEADNSYG